MCVRARVSDQKVINDPSSLKERASGDVQLRSSERGKARWKLACVHGCRCKCGHLFTNAYVYAFVCARARVCVSARSHAQQIASVYLVWGDSRKEGRLTSCRLQAPTRHMVITQPHSQLLFHTHGRTHAHAHTHADNAFTWVRKQTSSAICRHVDFDATETWRKTKQVNVHSVWKR